MSIIALLHNLLKEKLPSIHATRLQALMAAVEAGLSGASVSMKEYRKRNDSGAVYDDPRVAVGPGVLTQLERERKRSQNARPSDTASPISLPVSICQTKPSSNF